MASWWRRGGVMVASWWRWYMHLSPFFHFQARRPLQILCSQSLREQEILKIELLLRYALEMQIRPENAA